MSNQQSTALQNSIYIDNGGSDHKETIDLDGLDHLFQWASEVVAEGEDSRLSSQREKRVRREVLDVVQKAREQRISAKSMDEVSYLQRRVIALLQKMTELTEENASLKQIMVAQYYALQRIPYLESQIKQLKTLEYEREAAVTERRYLMDALSKLKVERDLLDQMLVAGDAENTRVAKLLRKAREEITTLKARRWWHLFFPPKEPA